MEKIQLCKGIEMSAKIFTKTWKELEKFFEVPITQFQEVYDEKTKTMEQQEELLFILVCQDNDITKEKMIELIDNDEDPDISVFTALAKAVSIFPGQKAGSEGRIKEELGKHK